MTPDNIIEQVHTQRKNAANHQENELQIYHNIFKCRDCSYCVISESEQLRECQHDTCCGIRWYIENF